MAIGNASLMLLINLLQQVCFIMTDSYKITLCTFFVVIETIAFSNGIVVYAITINVHVHVVFFLACLKFKVELWNYRYESL